MTISAKKRLLDAGTLVIFITVAALVLFPVYLTIITAFKTQAESAAGFFTPPTRLYLNNFVGVITDDGFGIYFANSLVITTVATALVVLVTPMISYAIARNFQRRFFKVSYLAVIAGIFVPFYVIMVPVVVLMGRLNLMNQLGLIVLYATYGQIQGVFLYVGYIRTAVPRIIEESAYMDGASITQTFWKIVYPIISPMTATLVVVRGLHHWNDFLLPVLILNRDSSYWTLPLFQYNFKTQYAYDYNAAFAAFLLSIIPIMILYMASQRYIINGLTAGAVKG